MDRRALQLAKEVCDFLMDRSRRANAYEGSPPFDDFAYGSAIADWERKGKPARAWFSTVDPHLLHYKETLTLHFKLPVVTREEARRREQEQKVRTKVVTELTWLEELGIVDPFGKEIDSSDDVEDS